MTALDKVKELKLELTLYLDSVKDDCPALAKEAVIEAISAQMVRLDKFIEHDCCYIIRGDDIDEMEVDDPFDVTLADNMEFYGDTSWDCFIWSAWDEDEIHIGSQRTYVAPKSHFDVHEGAIIEDSKNL